LVAAPSRSLVLIARGPKIDLLRSAAKQAYDRGDHPVSPTVLELTKKGWRAK